MADLHLHTALSPCASPDMTPPRIVREAVSQGLALIAVCDHNSLRQCPGRGSGPAGDRLAVIPGMEITTAEEVHVLGLFPSPEAAESAACSVQTGLPAWAPPRGCTQQRLLDEEGRILGYESHLLAGSSGLSLAEAVALIRSLGGLAVASHVDRRSFSVISQLGFLPAEVRFDALEISAAGAARGRAAEFLPAGPAAAVLLGRPLARRRWAPAARYWTRKRRASRSWPWPCGARGAGGAALRELALHILDLVENALRAGAGTIAVSVEEDAQADRLVIRVEDDGPGLEAPLEQALDPFFSTKPGKKTGLGPEPVPLPAGAGRAAACTLSRSRAGRPGGPGGNGAGARGPQPPRRPGHHPVHRGGLQPAGGAALQPAHGRQALELQLPGAGRGNGGQRRRQPVHRWPVKYTGTSRRAWPPSGSRSKA